MQRSQCLPCQVLVLPSQFSINPRQSLLLITPNYHIYEILRNTLALNNKLLPPQHKQTPTSTITFVDDEVVITQPSFQILCLHFTQMCLRQKKHVWFLALLDFQKHMNCLGTRKAQQFQAKIFIVLGHSPRRRAPI